MRALWAVCAAVLAVACAAGLTITLDVDGRAVDLTVGANEDFLGAATRWCANNDVSDDAVGLIVSELERAEAEALASTPVLTLAIETDSGTHDLVLLKSQTPAGAAAAFVKAHGVVTEGAVEAIVSALNARLTQMPPDPPTPVVTIQVDVGEGLVPLDVMPGVSPVAAATEFVRQYGFPEDNVQPIVDAIQRKLRESVPPVITRVPIVVDDVEHIVNLEAGQEPSVAARAFVSNMGLREHPRFEEFVRAISGAIVRQLSAQQAGAGAEAPVETPAAAVQDTLPAEPAVEYRTISLTVKDTSYDLEFPVGRPARELADAFCTQEWAFMKGVLEEGGSRNVNLSDCVDVVADSIHRQQAA